MKLGQMIWIQLRKQTFAMFYILSTGNQD